MSYNSVGWRLTPKGFLVNALAERGMDKDAADNVWHELEAFSVKRLREDDEDAEFAGIVFDGEGGEVVGMDAMGEEGYDEYEV